MDPHIWPRKKQDHQLEHTYSSYVRILDVAKGCWRPWTIGRSGETWPGASVLAARHDDDDDDTSSIPIELYEIPQIFYIRIFQNPYCPVAWDCIIHRLLLCLGVSPPPTRTSVLIMRLSNLMVRFHTHCLLYTYCIYTYIYIHLNILGGVLVV